MKQGGFADKFEGYMKQGFYSLASPVWSNFGRSRGLPISCNGVYIEDKMHSILEKQADEKKKLLEEVKKNELYNKFKNIFHDAELIDVIDKKD